MRAARAASHAAAAVALTVALAAAGTSSATAPRRSGARLNDLQIVGTHNSFHVEPEPSLL